MTQVQTSATVVTTRWVGVGRSEKADSRAAAAEAVTAALAGGGAIGPAKAFVVFCSDDYDLPTLAAALQVAVGDAPVIGCSTAGEIATGHAGDAGVVVVAFGGDGFSAATAVGTGAADDPRAAGEAAAACLQDVDDLPHKVVLLLSDGLSGGQQDVIRGAYGAVGATIPLVGACAGDQLKMVRTFQLYGDRVLDGAVVGLALASDSPFGVGVRHGWRKVGEPVVVTKSDATRVYLLDDEPALDVYLRRLGAPAEVCEDPAAFTRFAMTHPLGVDRRGGEEVRLVVGGDFDERSLCFIASVPQGGLASFMEGDEETVLGATDDACAEAIDGLDGRAPIGVLAFDCVARRGVIGDLVADEVARIDRLVGGAPVAGFYSYGEIARTRGINGFHNQTLVVLAVS